MNKKEFDPETLLTFKGIIKEFINDIYNSFPELQETIDGDKLLGAFKYLKDDNLQNETMEILEYCCGIYPSRFFDILYKNEDIFKNDNLNNEINCHFLPKIDFKKLWPLIDSETKTKDTIWKYLQIILFTCSKNIEGSESFGEAAKLFEAIDENDLFKKLEETISEMGDIFDISENINFSKDVSSAMPDVFGLHNHLKGILEGSLGKLAHEIAEETAQELHNDMSGSETVGDIFQKLMKNPQKLLNMIKKVGNKLDEKLKSGEIKESELMKEASELMEKMKKMPGMGGMDKILSKMGVPGGKNINFNAMQSKMKSNIKAATQRERMLKKLEERRKEKLKLEKNMNDKSPIEFVHSSFGEGMEKSKRSERNKKRRKKKNKNKNKKK
tara:strand:- start:3805 stop:4959 length:1155 start_codon:yes stop_codon:yes gene_type:complete